MSTLKVGTIQDHANSNTAISIDSAGRILTPARPAFRAFLTANIPNGNYTAPAAGSDFVFNAESYDIGGDYSTTSGKFIVPISGLYHLNANIYGSVTDAANWCSVYIFVDGSQTSRTIEDPQGGNYGMPQITDNLQLTAGQEVTIRLGASNDTSIDVSGSADGSLTNFSGFLIG